MNNSFYSNIEYFIKDSDQFSDEYNDLDKDLMNLKFDINNSTSDYMNCTFLASYIENSLNTTILYYLRNCSNNSHTYGPTINNYGEIFFTIIPLILLIALFIYCMYITNIKNKNERTNKRKIINYCNIINDEVFYEEEYV